MLGQQLRYVVRKLVHSPLFTGVALVTLAIAIGANTAVFSVVNAVVIKPLPFEDADRLVGLWHTAPGLNFDLVNQSPALHFTYREEGRVFEDVGMWSTSSAAITGLEEPEQVQSIYVTESTFRILGVQPHVGRLFNAEDDSPNAPLTVVLTHNYWQGRFSGDPQAIGETMRINGRSYEIIGVLRPDMQFLDFDPALFLPYQFDRAEVFFGNFSYQGLAKLKAGATIEQANADIARMVPLATEKFPSGVSLQMLQEAGFAPRVRSLKADAIGNIGGTLWVLLGTVGLVLLIACANVANLFLVRAEERGQEVAVRSALGASRWQVARGFLLETVLLGITGGVIGLALAWGSLKLLVSMAPSSLPRLDEIAIDPYVLIFTLGISVLSGLLFGIFPVLRVGNDFVSSLKEGGRGGGAGRERHRTRKTLVVVQVALALVLAVGSGLMLRSFQALRDVEPGFQRPEEVFTARVTIPTAEIEDPEELVRAHELIQQRLSEIGGVELVGASSSVPMDQSNSNDALEPEDFPVEEGMLPPIRRFKWVAPQYFDVMGIPLLAGRAIGWGDIHERANVVVVNGAFVNEYWDNPAAALGKRVRLPIIEGLTEDPPWREIIGVVGDVHDDGVNEDPPPIIYWPMAQADFWDEETSVRRSMVYALRTTRTGDPALQQEVRDAVWSVNSNLPLASVRLMDEILRRSMARTSFTLVMLAIAAGTALLLGAVGIYGVSSYVVSQRSREIGIRMALGAQSSDVSGMVLREGAVLTGLGVIVGLGAAVGLTRLMSALLFGVSAVDPVTYVAVAAGLASVAMLATYVPARRATRVNPVEALRFK